MALGFSVGSLASSIALLFWKPLALNTLALNPSDWIFPERIYCIEPLATAPIRFSGHRLRYESTKFTPSRISICQLFPHFTHPAYMYKLFPINSNHFMWACVATAFDVRVVPS